MDLSFPNPLHFVVLFASLFLLLLLIFKPKKSPPANPKLPPGKTGWPVIGETLEYVMAGRNGNPGKFVDERMKKYSHDVFKTSLLGENMAVFCGAAGNKFLFSNENKLVTTWYPDSVQKVILPHPSHAETDVGLGVTRMRSIVPEFLKPEALKNYVSIMDSTTRQHIEEKWAQNNEVKVVPLAKKYTFALACRLFLSIDDPKHVAKLSNHFARVTDGLISLPLNFPGTSFYRAVKAGNMIREEVLAIIKQRKMELSEKRDATVGIDLLSRMLLYTDENGKFVSEMVIASMILGLLIASFDTTSALITSVVNYLAEFPDIYSKVLEEQMEITKSKGPNELLNWDDIQKMKYSWSVANETMRLAPPAQGFFKVAISDFTFAGFSIPTGWKEYWTPYSTNKNPTYFPNPEKFDPSRFEGNGPAPYTFVPFGGGPRMCPGREYARVEVLVFIHNVVTKFEWEKLIPNEKIVYITSPIPANGLPIRLQPHKK
ncbi:hypothetical protein L1049_028609 [Liquidambar formosana]|uniref:Cytochrome P450 n=1 Tax=Liquidambar formosana TaxID=63359 RepID=A0AAP0N5R9_LIQFO